MTAKEIDPSKRTTPAYRPLPPTPKEALATAIAKEALKGPAPVKYPSFYKSTRPLSGNLKIPADPNTLTRLISELVDQASDPNQREASIKQARELLDEVFVEVCLSDEDYPTRQAWLNSLLLGSNSILSFARYHHLETSETRFSLICTKILKQIELELRTEAIETPAVSDTADQHAKSSSRLLTWRVVKISLAIFALAGLFFAARIGINHYLIKK